MFMLPVVENAELDGCNKEQPLHLQGISKDEFRQLLKIMYPRSERLLLLRRAI